MIDPDDFKDDAYGWLTNQCGHGVLGIAIAIYGTWLGLPDLALWPVALVAYWLVFELWFQRARLFLDGLMDAFHVASGVAVLAAGEWRPAVMTVWALVLGVGYWKRL